MILNSKTRNFTIVFLLSVVIGFAGNPDRTGQAGASELLINPWSRSSGWNGLNSASIHGVEAMNVNVGGLAFTKKTEFIFSRTIWLKGSEVFINSVGLAQKVGKSGVIGLGVFSQDFGKITTTTTKIPDGGIGTYSPQNVNISMSYAREFSNSIYGGLLVRGISEGISDVKALGVAFDAGIQYVTGKNNNIKFGINIKNIGTPMRFSGDGLSFRTLDPGGKDNKLAVEQRTEKFELPSLFNIGGAYDLKIEEFHRITFVGNFTSNSFSRDQIGIGAEYSFREYFMVRTGYSYEKPNSDKQRINALTGFSAGVTIEVPLKKNATTLGVDYSYRSSNPFSGTHSFGVRLNL